MKKPGLNSRAFSLMLKTLLINRFFWKYHHFILSLDLYTRFDHPNVDPD